MLTTLDRYLLKEVIQTWAAVTVVLLLIMLSSRFARYLGEAAAGQLPADVVFTLLSLTSIHYMTVLVPVSLFLAVMLMLGRLYKDSEMAAMMACGIGYGRFAGVHPLP
ncbi:MAG: LptF/LptG family permease [Xanthomonadaceae bacterium]|nr:LptF/LptG family permease [Xanthomonadaceae bacterium]